MATASWENSYWFRNRDDRRCAPGPVHGVFPPFRAFGPQTLVFILCLHQSVSIRRSSSTWESNRLKIRMRWHGLPKPAALTPMCCWFKSGLRQAFWPRQATAPLGRWCPNAQRRVAVAKNPGKELFSPEAKKPRKTAYTRNSRIITGPVFRYCIFPKMNSTRATAAKKIIGRANLSTATTELSVATISADW